MGLDPGTAIVAVGEGRSCTRQREVDTGYRVEGEGD